MIPHEVTGKSRELRQYVKLYWRQFLSQERPQLFGPYIRDFAADGGYQEASKLMDRPSSAYLRAFTTLILFAVTCGAALWRDIDILMTSDCELERMLVVKDCSKQNEFTDFDQVFRDKCNGKHPKLRWNHRFLLTLQMAKWTPFFPHHTLDQYHAVKIIAFWEVAWFAAVFTWCITLVGRSIQRDDDDVNKWVDISRMFWHAFPHLRKFGAIRLLYFIIPNVLKFDGDALLYEAQHARIGICLWRYARFARFVISRMLCGVVGLDSLLVKYRMAASLFNSSHPFTDCDWKRIIDGLLFFFQVLNVVDIKKLFMKRLQRFVFAGKDGSMDADEMGFQHFWKAFIAKRIYDSFGVCNGTIVMLSFQDHEFQRLMITDDKEVQTSGRTPVPSPMTSVNLEGFRGDTMPF